MKYKSAKTTKEFKATKYGWEITVPIGSRVSNKTACGFDDNYRFLEYPETAKIAEKTTGFKNSMLKHDLIHYGLDIPAEYCEGYES